MNKPSTQPDVLSLPTSGGAISGIGESFFASAFTGSATFNVPLALSPGRNGFGPAINLVYGAGHGNGPFGLGWELSLPRITRKTDRGLPHYDDRDTFVIAGLDELVPATTPPATTATHLVTRYLPRTEGSYAKVEEWTDLATGRAHWVATTVDNITSVFGRHPSARLSDPADDARVYEWLLEETSDAYGNHMLYEYARDDPRLYTSSDVCLSRSDSFEDNRTPAQLYLRRILYGDLPQPLVDRSGGTPITWPDGSPVGVLRGGRRYGFEVVFDYGDWAIPTVDPHQTPLEGSQERFGPDPAVSAVGNPVPVRVDRCSSFRAGFEVRTLRRCRRVLMFHHFAELGAPTLVKSTDLEYRVDEQSSLSLLSAIRVTGYRRDETGAYRVRSMPPVTFNYSEFRPHEQRYRPLTTRGAALPASPLSDPDLSLVDLDSVALPGFLEGTGGVFRFWSNAGGGEFEPPRLLEGLPSSLSLGARGVGFGDMAGDGQLDLLVHSGPSPGFFEIGAEGSWRPFVPYRRAASFDLDNANVRLVDLTGSGSSDVLMTGPEDLMWFECLGEEGFGPARRVARGDVDAFFDDAGGRVRLADMTGDGLRDIVVMHSGRVEYWPNLGYGRFGHRVTMTGAPRWGDDQDPRRLFLVDLDGTGCADIVCVGNGRVDFWFNQCGNRWSDRQTLIGTPLVASDTSLAFADVFGTGTATLVWSWPYAGQPESHYQALDFCGGSKPYVLTEMRNNLGGITRVSYSSSTAHYLRDREDGLQWVTTLPFPVQVVDRVELSDEFNRSRRVTVYRYHHGHFDGGEREFRGFGRVDQWDSERWIPSQGFGPPTETRTWFHTGSYDGLGQRAQESAIERYQGEYYHGDIRAPVLGDDIFPVLEAPARARRVLRGLVLRTESYARDGTEKELHPYEVTAHRHEVREVQPAGERTNGVFAAHEIETVTARYERDPHHPRIGHELTLEVDRFGNAVRRLIVAYGRRAPSTDLPSDGDRARQAQTWMTLEENDYTNAVDDPALVGSPYRSPLPSESRTFEVTGLTPQGQYFTIEDFGASTSAVLATASELPYEGTAPQDGVPRKRLISHVVTRYRSNDLATLLPIGQLHSLAVQGESYQLALTAGLVSSVFGARVDQSVLSTDGGYTNLGGPDWWAPSGRVFLSPDHGVTPAQELAFARVHWFNPARVVNPYGAVSVLEYDNYDLFVVRKEDPLGNSISVRIDYRLLQPVEMIDANGNHAEVLHDTLGMVVATSVSGKAGEQLGDSLDGVSADLSESDRDEFASDPVATAPRLLGGATTRTVYDLDAPARADLPAYAAVISRTRHVSDVTQDRPEDLQIRISYSDGSGREAQKKVRAEPGPVVEGGPVVSRRWIGTGWTTYDHKGNPIRRHEPFFDDEAVFRPVNQAGNPTTFFYDAAARVVGTLYPDHSWRKVSFTAWHQEHWDANDTVLIPDPSHDVDVGPCFAELPTGDYRPTWFEARQGGVLGADEQVAATRAADHAATPTRTYADALGRVIVTVANNRSPSGSTVVEESYVSRTFFDVLGRQRRIEDSAGRTCAQFDYDMLGSTIHQVELDGPERWFLTNVTGQPIGAWSTDGITARTTYDPLLRPVDSLVTDDSGTERHASRIVYGESQPNPEAHNLRGRLAAVSDEAGVLRMEAYDFKGNLLSSTRQFLADHAVRPDWRMSPPLSPEVFSSATAYDAFNRTVGISTPRTLIGAPSLIRPSYQEGTLLDRLDVVVRGATSSVPVVESIIYNARGQRLRTRFGNGLITTYDYGAADLRLRRLLTTRTADGAVLQDLVYTYDAVGNVTHIHDGTTQTIFYSNAVVTADNDFVYDALYRLVEARGREHRGQVGASTPRWDDSSRAGLVHPHDGRAMRRYVERYSYDRVANLQQVVHRAPGGDWTRTYQYHEPSSADSSVFSNRLSSVQVGAGPAEPFGYDNRGNLEAMSHLPALDWDSFDRLERADLGLAGEVYYGYDSSGQRVRKVVERPGGVEEETLSLGAFELWRRRDGSGNVTSVKETLHIMDDRQRVALVETVSRDAGGSSSDTSAVYLQMGNHLGSIGMEVDEQGGVVSYEEYYPYGATSYQAAPAGLRARKRFRFLAKERDQETGLCYIGARYLAPWLGRWISADPTGVGRGLNGYAYCGGNPVGKLDADGADWDWINPTNWCNPFSSQCDVVVDDIAVGAVKAGVGMAKDTVTRTIDLTSMFSPPALLGHLTGWYDISTCLSPECQKYDPTKSVMSNVKGNVYDVTVGGTVELAKQVYEGNPEAVGALGMAAALGKAAGGRGGGGGAIRIPVPKLVVQVAEGGIPLPALAVGEIAVARPSLAAVSGPALATSLTSAALNAGPPSGGGPPVRRIKEGEGREPTRVKPPSETARPKSQRGSTPWDAGALADRGMSVRVAFPRSPLHHVIPRELLKNPRVRGLLEKRGIDIDDFCVQLSEGEHSAIHSAIDRQGRNYNQKWADFFERSPDATPAQIINFAEKMREWVKIDMSLPYQRYR